MQINPDSLNLRQLFSVKDILVSRGFELLKENNETNTLILCKNIGYGEKIYLFDILYQIFHNTESRNELLNFIETDFEPKDKLVLKLINSEHFIKDRNLFSNTFEWFIGELMVRKFKAFSYSFGAIINEVQRNSDGGNAGDYDTLVVQRNTNLIYFECKTGRFDRKAIIKSIERSISLHTEFLVFLIMSKINENQLKDCLRNAQYPNYANPKLLKLNIKSSFEHIYKWHNCYFISGDENIEEQMMTVLRINQARKIIKFYDSEIDFSHYEKLGYNYSEL